MSLSIGIVGLPNVGKSTLFNALTRAQVLAANYPFATIEPNIGIAEVPDARLGVLAELFHSERVLPAQVTFVDIAGLVRGAASGEGLGNQFLAAIRETDAICEVVRVFRDDDVVHVDGDVDPDRDISTILTEMILADLQTVERAIPRLERDAKRAGDAAARLAGVVAVRDWLDGGHALSAAGPQLDRAPVDELHLLTAKAFIYAFNVDEADLADPERRAALLASVAPAPAVVLSAQIESELVDLDAAEAAELLAGYGQGESGLAQLSRVGFATLGLQTFLTAGPKEARAWTIHQGDTAPVAAGVIHTDFQKHFIKAEVITFEDLVAAGTVAAARSVGRARIEGKEYVMRDGDVVEFRVNA